MRQPAANGRGDSHPPRADREAEQLAVARGAGVSDRVLDGAYRLDDVAKTVRVVSALEPGQPGPDWAPAGREPLNVSRECREASTPCP